LPVAAAETVEGAATARRLRGGGARRRVCPRVERAVRCKWCAGSCHPPCAAVRRPLAGCITVGGGVRTCGCARRFAHRVPHCCCCWRRPTDRVARGSLGGPGSWEEAPAASTGVCAGAPSPLPVGFHTGPRSRFPPEVTRAAPPPTRGNGPVFGQQRVSIAPLLPPSPPTFPASARRRCWTWRRWGA